MSAELPIIKEPHPGFATQSLSLSLRRCIHKSSIGANVGIALNILRRNGYASITTTQRFISNDIDKIFAFMVLINLLVSYPLIGYDVRSHPPMGIIYLATIATSPLELPR
ncbi:MAG: hypothetical protein HWQ43_14145 [Nostoc sp. JL31]|uniref:hypothetical protein n=1 Tax=Nostoc sp. JL31 TaxID=2815395 RepID=UPI0025D1678D|nr:hypothetical protein [Nostoc sp. JL31]MBN3890249.1 hypothetical protein [Nostoc sp. JL31]